MKVKDFRLSSIWVEACPELVGLDDHGRFGPIIRPGDYAALFNALLISDADPLVSVPWPRIQPGGYPDRNEYWNDYVIRELRDHFKDNAGVGAWKEIVPLRRKTSLVRIEGTDRCFVEGWYWPHGIGVIVTFWCQRPLSPTGLTETADQLLRGRLRVAWQDGQREETTLNALSDAALHKLRQEAFGTIAAGYRPQPMRVLTLVKAAHDTGDTDQEAARKTLLDSAISAAGGDPNQQAPADRNIYSMSRSRVIWRPDRALSNSTRVHTMGCLHRNVVVATMQVASLLRAAEMLGAASENSALPARVEPYARKMSGLIGRIYGGVETYYQKCLRDQIAAANAKGAIDALRRAMTMSLLTENPKGGDPKPADVKP